MSAVTYQLPENLASFSRISMRPVSVTQTSRSTLTPLFRTRGVLSTYWTAQIDFAAMNDDLWRDLESFIALLDGQRNRVMLYDPSRERPLGNGFGSAVTYSWEYNGTPYAWEYDGTSYLWQAGAKTSVWLASAAVRGADKITLAGLTASTSRAVKKGDLFGLGGNIYMAVTDANSDSSGEALVSIRPRLRKPAAALATVRVDKPRGRFTLASSEAFDMSVESGKIARGASLSLIEVPDLGTVY